MILLTAIGIASVALAITGILLIRSARKAGAILIIVLAGTGTLQAQGVTLSMELHIKGDTAIVLYSSIPLNEEQLAGLQPLNIEEMADTYKDRKKAAIKRGDEQYQRNHPKRKYRRKHQLPSDAQPFINAPAVKQGFWAMLRRAFGG